MEPKDIKAKIVLAGTTQAAIARHLGVSSNAVGRVLRGESRSTRIEFELSKIVGKVINNAPHRRRGRRKTVWTGQVVA